MTLYTIASGKRFIDAAILCRKSFLRHNPDIKFKIFIPSGEFDESIAGAHPFDLPVFPAEIVKRKPLVSLLFSKFGVVNHLIKDDYIGFIDADCYCRQPVFTMSLRKILDRGYFGVTSDAKVMIRKLEIEDCGYPLVWKLYFNSGVVFWKTGPASQIMGRFGEWFRSNIDWLTHLPFGDQTWINYYLNTSGGAVLYDLGYFWNFRGRYLDPRTRIWHPGGRDSTGIEDIKRLEAKYEQ